MSTRVSLWVREIEEMRDRAVVHGEVWLGPVVVGDCFTATTRADHEVAVRLTLTDLTAPPDAQEPGRVPRVIATVEGLGIDLVRAGDVLVGEVARREVLDLHQR